MNLNAQDFKIGVLAGFDMVNSDLPNKPDSYRDLRIFYPMVSFNANLYIGYKSAGLLGFSAEPGFIRKGGIQQYNKNTKEDDLRFNLNYIQVPILANIQLTQNLFFSVGPEFAYLISAKIRYMKYPDVKANYSEFYDKKFEASGLIGINYNIIANIDIGLRYNHGLTYTNEIEYPDNLGMIKVYNQYIQFIVRYKIKTGGNST